MSLLSLLVVVLVMGLVIYLIQMLPLPEPFMSVARVIVIVICIIWLLRMIGFLPDMNWRVIK